MRYVKLGNTGLDVSKICVGCMSFGVPSGGSHAWTLDEETSRGFIRQAIDAGLNFFDTANVYSVGSSEEILGRALTDFANRDEVVIATKVHGTMRPGRNAGGLSRKAIMTEIDASLRRLGTDYTISTKSTAMTRRRQSKKLCARCMISSSKGKFVT
jgi:1-deoxyxylulose-5-phosphate synthase